jgi:hypothetical protein
VNFPLELGDAGLQFKECLLLGGLPGDDFAHEALPSPMALLIPAVCMFME